ncbi:hypothetical protein HK13_06820 [Acetobacter indonesiensis]|nr:hypothetical protein HK13_06820 [Acetobacter indonesiensis]
MSGLDGGDEKRPAPLTQSVQHTTPHILSACVQSGECPGAVIANAQIPEAARYNDFLRWCRQDFTGHGLAIFFIEFRCSWHLVQPHLAKPRTAQIHPHIPVPVCVL